MLVYAMGVHLQQLNNTYSSRSDTLNLGTVPYWREYFKHVYTPVQTARK